MSRSSGFAMFMSGHGIPQTDSWSRQPTGTERRLRQRHEERSAMRLTQWFENLRSDAIFALRQLRGAPTFTAIAALTLALGIGANGAIFALVDAALLRPLEFRDPDRLVKVWELAPSS